MATKIVGDRFRRAALAAAAVTVTLGPSALAQTDYSNRQPPKVEQSTQSRAVATPPLEVLGSGEESPRAFGVTGGDVAGLAALGAGAVAVGTVFVRAGRRRRTT